MTRVLNHLGHYIYKVVYSISALFVSEDCLALGWTHEEYSQIQKQLLKTMGCSKEDRVLDFGCGTGFHVRLLAPSVKEATGIDHVPAMVNRARRNIRYCSNAKIMLNKSENIPFPENTFSKIVCCGVFQYFSDFDYVRNILKEMFRVTENNGRIFIFDIPDRNEKRFPKIKAKDIWCPITVFRKIIEYFFASSFVPQELVDYCRSEDMIPHITGDVKTIPSHHDYFSCEIEIRK